MKETELNEVLEEENLLDDTATKGIITDISQDIEAGLTCCYGDYKNWKLEKTLEK